MATSFATPPLNHRTAADVDVPTHHLAYHPRQIPAPPLPPTPPGSAGSSPPPSYIPPTGAPSTSTIPHASTLASFARPSIPSALELGGSPSMGQDAGPSRRHHFDLPHTPQGKGFPANVQGGEGGGYGEGDGPYRAYQNGTIPDAGGPRRRLEYEPGWEGTLSAAIASFLASARAAWASADAANHSLLDGANGTPGGHLRGSSSTSTPVFIIVRRIAVLAQGVSMSSIRFGLLCMIWYSTSAFSSNTGKVILNNFRYPVTLTFIQFGFVAGWCAVFIAARAGIANGKFAAGGVGGVRGAVNLLGIKRPSRTALIEMFIMSLFQIAGHVFSSMAIARVPVSTVHTIKALSPLFTVMAYAGLFGVRYSGPTYVSLLPLTLGVMLACSFDLRANAVGFLCALGSTIVFVSQNIFGKKLLPKESDGSTAKGANAGAHGTTGGRMDKLSLLFYSSGMAFLLMIPIWLWSDGGALVSAFFSTSYDAATHARISGPLALIFYFICNGSVHFAQCILAFAILSRTSPVTYSIASLIKRIAVICMAIVWFGQKTSLVQAFGMMMTFTGLWMYNRAKSDVDKGERKRGQVERKADLLLPSNKEDARILDGYSDSSRAVSPMPLFAGAAYSHGVSASPQPRSLANGFASTSTGLHPAQAHSPISLSSTAKNTLSPPPPSSHVLGRTSTLPAPRAPSPRLPSHMFADAGRGSPADGVTSGAQASTTVLPKRRGPSVSLDKYQAGLVGVGLR